MAEPVVVLWDLYQALRNDRFYQARLTEQPYGIIQQVMAMMAERLKVNGHTIRCINYSCWYLDKLDCFAAVTVMIYSHINAQEMDINETYAGIIVPEEWDMIETRAALEDSLSKKFISSQQVMHFFRCYKLPLPLLLYKNEPDNSLNVVNELFGPEEQRHGSGMQFNLDDIAPIVMKLRRDTKETPAPEADLAPPKLISQPPEALVETLRVQGVTDRSELAKGLQRHGIILKEIGRVLRRDGDIDSDEANLKRAQRLLSN